MTRHRPGSGLHRVVDHVRAQWRRSKIELADEHQDEVWEVVLSRREFLRRSGAVGAAFVSGGPSAAMQVAPEAMRPSVANGGVVSSCERTMLGSAVNTGFRLVCGERPKGLQIVLSGLGSLRAGTTTLPALSSVSRLTETASLG